MVVVARLLESNRDLLVQYIHYITNVYDAHPQYLKHYLNLALDFSKIQNPFLKRNLGQLLRRKLQLPKLLLDNLQSPISDWFNLSDSFLLELQYLLGGIYCEKLIKKVIIKTEHDRLLQFFGEEKYACIMKRVSLYKPLISKRIQVKIQAQDLIEIIKEVGRYLFLYALGNVEKNVLQRFTLKFNNTVSWEKPELIDPEAQIKLLQLCHLLMTKELSWEG